eukprot:CAMPEP_0201489750 /NCGR_PEP_ID=MMETSP0151_2-20130828/23551_1 /ASSEMBLY_ACC=CAM_ASM_000257 /TAXON_ID=200890 /ORGANISM="Paramoeba atlantica, Strain 621/1 / CCAP 1560/9" /LENGTH=447 /DNA_ID=CAMNT_0047875437 /DNA_START=18 /DNA_END=1361 /DNA_ORIENTATION=-
MDFFIQTSFFLLCLLFVGAQFDTTYQLDLGEDTLVAGLPISKKASPSDFDVSVKYSRKSQSVLCSWRFCITRSFPGSFSVNSSTPETTSLLDETDGCRVVSSDEILDGDTKLKGTINEKAFALPASGDFWLMGELLEDPCSVSVFVSGKQCKTEKYGADCAPISTFIMFQNGQEISGSPPSQAVYALQTPDSPSSQAIVNLTWTSEQATVQGKIYALLNGIPSDEWFDYSSDINTPNGNVLFSISSPRPNSVYFIAIFMQSGNITLVQPTSNVPLCTSSQGVGPNCEYTPLPIPASVQGHITPSTACPDGWCYLEIHYAKSNVIIEDLADQPRTFEIYFQPGSPPTNEGFDTSIKPGVIFYPQTPTDKKTIKSTPNFIGVYVGTSTDEFSFNFGQPETYPFLQEEDSDNSGLGAGAIVGIIIGVLVVAALAGGLIYYRTKHSEFESI